MGAEVERFEETLLTQLFIQLKALVQKRDNSEIAKSCCCLLKLLKYQTDELNVVV
jgi:hypothetical protein